MTSSRRLFPPVLQGPATRNARLWSAIWLLALCPLVSHAQAHAQGHVATSDALRAADPASPVAARKAPPPSPAPVPSPQLPTNAAEALAIWQRANQQVAAFPRGHIDILRWEAQNTAAAPPAQAAPAAPLLADEALRLSLTQRPDLLARPGMGWADLASVQSAWLEHARAVQNAWIDAVASQDMLRQQQARLDAAHSGTELGRRMVVAGNWSQARLMREQLVHAREQAATLQAQQAVLESHEHLARLMGQWDPQAIDALMQRLPAQLPDLPGQPQAGAGLSGQELEAAAVRSHPRLALKRTETQRHLAAVHPTRRGAWAQALQASLQRLPSEGLPTRPLAITDPRLANDHSLERALEAEATLLELAGERRSAARRAWTNLQTTHALARHAQETVLPLQTALEQETLLRYNGMLQSTWELLEASRERMQATSDAAAARRDFWLAQLALNHLLAGGDYTPAEPSATGGARATAAQPGH
ncbi:MAG: hypothetical protein MUF44_15490 [Hydrogenophaga sp.]|jgi:hypothetical protein|nr:hypothetical protein [Hydrogenophaga sp.]